MINLDLKDRKILYELDLNSRQTYNEIAKKVGLSKDSVAYRIEALKNAGIIKQFHAVIDSGKLGLISFRLYLKFQSLTPEKEAEIIHYLKNKKIVTWLVSIEGEYDLGMWVLAQSIKEMNAFWKELLEKYTNQIEKRWLTIFTHVSYFPRTYLLEKENNDKEFVFITEPQESDLDQTDLEILRLIATNARIPTIEIANKLSITPKTVSSRLQLLEKMSVIVGYRTLFDLEKLGYQYFKVHFNLHDVTQKREKTFRAFIKQHPNIIYDNEVLGGDDIEIEVQVHDLVQLRAILSEVKHLFSDLIKEYRYFLFYKEHKFVFMPI